MDSAGPAPKRDYRAPNDVEHEPRVALAIDDINELGMSVPDAARKHDFKVHTLRRRLKAGGPLALKFWVKQSDFLSTEEERLVVRLLTIWRMAGAKVSTERFLGICRRFAAFSGRLIRPAEGWRLEFNADWLEGFIERHPEIKARKSLISGSGTKAKQLDIDDDLVERYAEMLHEASKREPLNNVIRALHGTRVGSASFTESRKRKAADDSDQDDEDVPGSSQGTAAGSKKSK